MISRNDPAVSPVVGVMLMLVVTIIIAAVVSAFSGGMFTGQHKTPQATISARPVIESIQDTNTANYASDYPAGFTAKNGVLFEHSGGDGFLLDDISVVLQRGDSKYTLTTSNNRTSSSCLPDAITTYLIKTGSTDKMISTGDRFMLYADNCAIDPTGSKISWTPYGASKGLSVYQNEKIQYVIVDRASSRAIASGEIIVK